jgi:hypothetical protein
LLSIISDPIILIFLPWRKSEFSVRSGGFPTLRVYRVIMYSEVFISLIRFITVISSSDNTSMSQLSTLTTFLQFSLCVIHIFVKLRSFDIDQYDIEIKIFNV